jgi:hypothetical protein
MRGIMGGIIGSIIGDIMPGMPQPPKPPIIPGMHALFMSHIAFSMWC